MHARQDGVSRSLTLVREVVRYLIDAREVGRQVHKVGVVLVDQLDQLALERRAVLLEVRQHLRVHEALR